VSFLRSSLAFLLLCAAVILESTVVLAVDLPRATPDLVLLVVLGIALVRGPVDGAVWGFVGGLLMDVVPPSDGAVGQWAFVVCLAGWVAGRSREAASRSALLPLLVVAVLSVGVQLGYAGLGSMLGDVRVTQAAAVRSLPAAVLYDLILAPFVVPLVMALMKRVQPAEIVL
jgi:rod shape-determining protein MreD